MLRKFITNRLLKWGFVQDTPDELNKFRKEMETFKHEYHLENNKTKHDINILNKQTEKRVKDMLDEQEISLLRTQQEAKNATAEVKLVKRDFDKNLSNAERRVGTSIESVSKSLQETNKTIDQNAKTAARDYKIKSDEVLEELKSVRKQIVEFEKLIKDLQNLPARVTDFTKNMEGYRKTIDTTVVNLTAVVEESKNKVDRFDETYNSMIRTSNKGAGKMNSQQWQDFDSEHNKL